MKNLVKVVTSLSADTTTVSAMYVAYFVLVFMIGTFVAKNAGAEVTAQAIPTTHVDQKIVGVD
jgi:hypothetical protein